MRDSNSGCVIAVSPSLKHYQANPIQKAVNSFKLT